MIELYFKNFVVFFVSVQVEDRVKH